MDFDSVLREVGDFGRYQKIRLVILSLPFTVATLHLFMQVFAAGQSDHWCQSWEDEKCENRNLSLIECESLKREHSIPVTIKDDNSTQFEQCEKYNVTAISMEAAIDIVDKETYLGRIPCDEGWVHDQSTFYSTVIVDFELVCDKSHLPNIAQSTYFAGVMLGGVFNGLAADTFGRRKTFLWCHSFSIFFGIATSFSVNMWMYIILRFFLSAFVNGAACFVLMTELVGPSKRVLVGNVTWIIFAVGFSVLAGLAKLIRNWRMLQLAATLPSIPILILIYLFVPESPRWLVNQRRDEEAEKVLRKIGKVNKKNLQEDAMVKLSSQISDEIHHSFSIQETFRELIQSPVVLFITINMCFNWMVHSFVYFGLSLSTSSLGINPYISFIVSGAVEIPAYLSCMFVAEWLGRKGSTFCTMLLAGICCCIIPLIPYGIFRALVGFMGKFFITISYSVVTTWAVELIPTSLRSSGLSLFFVTSQIGSILAPLIFLLGDVWLNLPFLLFGSFAIAAGILCLFLPETKGRPLPTTAKDTIRLYRKVASTDEKEHGNTYSKVPTSTDL